MKGLISLCKKVTKTIFDPYGGKHISDIRVLRDKHHFCVHITCI